jgi:hypothetical protein
VHSVSSATLHADTWSTQPPVRSRIPGNAQSCRHSLAQRRAASSHKQQGSPPSLPSLRNACKPASGALGGWAKGRWACSCAQPCGIGLVPCAHALQQAVAICTHMPVRPFRPCAFSCVALPLLEHQRCASAPPSGPDVPSTR